MKTILKTLVLGVVPILAATAVVDRGLAADKGSQLIFHTNMDHQNFISVSNANDGKAVTVLVQYYNDEMTVVLFYLRVIPGGGNFLVDPFNHEIPGTASEDGDGMEIPGTATNVGDVLGGLPAMTQTTGDKLPGINSGRFLVVVTAVGANLGVDHNEDGKIADVVGRTGITDDTIAVALGGYRIRLGKVALIRKQSTDATPPVVTWDQPFTDDQAATAASFAFTAETNRAETVNVLFPKYLAEDMHGIDNIDNGGTLSLVGSGLGLTNKEEVTKIQEDGSSMDESTKNVGDLSVGNAMAISFNHLTGHFTEALSETAAGGTDQTASWGGTPIIRPAVSNTANGMSAYSNGAAPDADTRMDYMLGDYYPLNGMDSMPVVNTQDQGWVSLATYNARVADDTDTVVTTALTNAPAAETTPATDFDNAAVRGLRGGRLAEKDAGGAEVVNVVTKGATRSGYTAPSKITDGPVVNRGLSGGALVLPALYGGGANTKQIILFLSASENFGAGGYKLIKALTRYSVTVHDNMGNVLPNPADERQFGGAGGPKLKGTSIIVEGMRVITNAAACGGKPEDMLDGYWTLDNLINDIPTASSGAKDFAGLDAMLDPMKNATPGFIKFKRGALKCVKPYGDGDSADGDGVPAVDTRTYEGGTLIVEEKNTDRTFVTTGQAVVKYITPSATFGASWSLKSPPSPAN